MQSEEVEQELLARHGADLTPSPRTGAIVDELLQGVVSDNFATGESREGSPEHIAQLQPQPQPQLHGAMLPEPEPQSPAHGAFLPEAEPRPQSHGALQGQQPLHTPVVTVPAMVSTLVTLVLCLL